LNSLVSLFGPFDRLRDRLDRPPPSADETKGSSTVSAEEPSYLFASNTLTSKNNDAIRRSAITPLLSPFVKKK
jgi:hypothetical protein